MIVLIEMVAISAGLVPDFALLAGTGIAIRVVKVLGMKLNVVTGTA